MPRSRTKAGAAAAAAGSGSNRVHKRALSAGTPNSVATPTTRSSKRIKESANSTPSQNKATPEKSKYFEAAQSDEESSVASPDEATESGYDDEDLSASETPESVSESEEYNSEDEVKAKKKKTQGRKSTGSKDTSEPAGSDLWREGVKTGLGPGKQVFIAKPKPRDDGGIKYMPDKIHPNTMAFLADLKKNNDREWLKRHDPDYRQSWKDWESFVDSLTERIAEVDDTVPELPPKDLVFRIYRDVRFSSDPTPYKPHFSAAWSRTGRKGPYAAYYVQIQPGGKSFVGGGLWHPEAQPLALLRRNIDRRPEQIRSVLTDSRIRKQLLGGLPPNETKAIKAFCNQNAENALKTKPKGFDADHPNIDLLRLRNFTIGKRLQDSDVLDKDALSKIMDLISALYPFISHLNSVVMPDDDDVDDDDNNDNDNDNEDGEDEDDSDAVGDEN